MYRDEYGFDVTTDEQPLLKCATATAIHFEYSTTDQVVQQQVCFPLNLAD